MKIPSVLSVAALLLLVLTPGASGQVSAPGQNQIQDPGMLGAGETDMVWDGVNSGNKLQVPVATKDVNIGGVITGPGMPCSPAWYDLTGDNIPDLIVADSIGYIWVFRNVGDAANPKFEHGEILPIFLHTYRKWWFDAPLEGSTFECPEYAPRIAVTNLTKQGIADLVVGTYYGEVYLLPLLSSAGKIRPKAFEAGPVELKMGFEDGYWGNMFSPALVDWDKDGRTDLLIGEGTYSANTVWWLRNEGSDSVPKFRADDRRPVAYGNGRDQLVPAVVDWDNDGKSDILVADSSGDVRVFLAKTLDSATGVLDAGEPPMRVQFGGSSNLGGLATIAVGDLNGDGLFDLLIGRNSGRIQMSLNKGTAGSPKFDAVQDLAGVDVEGRIKVPNQWRLAVTPGLPGAFLQQVNEADNTPGAGRSGGLCVKLSYYTGSNSLTADKFPDINPTRLDKIYYTAKPNAKVGSSCTISFWYKATGFEELAVHYRLRERDIVKHVSRRGEEVDPYPIISDINRSQAIPSSASWRQFKWTFKIEGKNKDSPTIYDLDIQWRGNGVLHYDDFTFTEN